MSDTSTTLSGNGGSTDSDEDLVELHWMKTPNVDMHQEHGVSVQALCGKWMEPNDDDLPGGLLIEAVTTRYVSCHRCDALHSLHVCAVEAAS